MWFVRHFNNERKMGLKFWLNVQKMPLRVMKAETEKTCGGVQAKRNNDWNVVEKRSVLGRGRWGGMDWERSGESGK